MRRIDGYDHRPGNHCGSTSLRNLSDCYGWGYDEATAFGLASGLGFTFFELPESPHRAFFGRPLWLEQAFFEHLGIGYDHRAGPDWEAVWTTVRETIAGGDPVMLFTDIYYLDYYGSDTHFTPHSLLAVGYEGGTDAGGTVLLSDSEFDEPQALPVDRLRDALGSDYSIPEPNRRLVVTDPTPDRAFADAAARAIRRTARYMLDPSTAPFELGPGDHGLAGVRRLADELPTWTDLPDPGWTVRFAYQNVERRGTGGGCFRRMYADFLQRAADAVSGVPDDAGDRMEAIADDWTAAGMTLKDASERDDASAMQPLLADASDAIHDLADREQALLETLWDAVGDAPA
jgi:hypothetical protein